MTRKYQDALSLPIDIIFYAVLVIGGALCVMHAGSALFADDFYYYYVVARNFVDSGSMSFDGIHPTNGFHPLWFAVVSLIYRASGSSDAIALPAIAVLSALLPLVGAVKVKCFLGAFVEHRASRVVANAMALFYGLAGLNLAFFGMETALFLALFPWLLSRLVRPLTGRMDVFLYTLLAAASVLSRIDSIMIVGVVWLAVVVETIGERGSLRDGAAQWIGTNAIPVILGGIPLIAYLAVNWHVFGGPIPQSATAKGLTVSPGPYRELLLFFTQRTGALLSAFYLIFLAFLLVALRSGVKGRLPWLLVILWPLVFYGILAFRSPWPLWPWYGYPLVACSPAVAVLALRSQVKDLYRVVFLALPAILIAGVVVAQQAGRLRTDHWSRPINAAALKLSEFARDNPGLYAMGDRAGVVGFVLGRPVLQLEGLVGGAEVIDAIKQQSDLIQFMKSQNVAYYITTNLERSADGCFLAAEPAQGGPSARHMTGTICADPVYEFSQDDDGQTVTTRIFKMAE